MAVDEFFFEMGHRLIFFEVRDGVGNSCRFRLADLM